jgi:hypothetical protein
MTLLGYVLILAVLLSFVIVRRLYDNYMYKKSIDTINKIAEELDMIQRSLDA